MRAVLLLVLVGFVVVSCDEKPKVSVDAKAAEGRSSASAAVEQEKKGNKIKTSGSASSSGSADSQGNSDASAEVSTGDNTSEETAETTESPTEAPETTTEAVETTVETEAPKEETTQTTVATTAKAQPKPKPSPNNQASKKVDVGGESSAPAQTPNVWTALDELRGKAALQSDEIQNLEKLAVPDQDYPILAAIPDPNTFRCDKTHQPGYYADTDFRCQVIRECDVNGILTSYLCPNRTIFNQITLTCDWFYNVDCGRATRFYDYSNPRLYHENWVLLDTPAKK